MENVSDRTADESGITKSECEKQKLYVVRHGQRVDFTFGKNWIERCIDEQGRYVRFDPNMPPSVFERTGGVRSFQDDSPLTMFGVTRARQLGESMLALGISFAHVYSSPALRCIQTAFHILQGMGCTYKSIFIEPGLFEWLAWHPNGLPKFMTIAELQEAGFKVIGDDVTTGNLSSHSLTPRATIDVSPSHSSIWTDWNLKESLRDYYNRADWVTREILKKNSDNEHVLLVAHKGSVDVCTRQLVGNQILTLKLFRKYVQTVPYCAVACCQKTAAQQTINKPIPDVSRISAVPKIDRAVQRPALKFSDHERTTIVKKTFKNKIGTLETIVQGSDQCWTLCDPMLPSLSRPSTGPTRKKYDWRIWL